MKIMHEKWKVQQRNRNLQKKKWRWKRMTKLKTLTERLNIRLHQTEERTIDLEDRTFEIIQTLEQEKWKIRKWDANKSSNMLFRNSQKGRRKRKSMWNNNGWLFSDLRRDFDIQIHETQRTPERLKNRKDFKNLNLFFKNITIYKPLAK